MKARQKFLSILLSLAVLLSLAAPALAGYAAGGGTRRAVVLFDDTADSAELLRALEETDGVKVTWTYSVLFHGAAVEGSGSALAELGRTSGVASVSQVRTYAHPQGETGEPPLTDSNSLPLMGAEGLLEQGLTGDGVVIAVLDSGLRVSHEAFRDYSLAQAPAISREDVAAFTEGGGTPGVWISDRIPFAYDYWGRDDDVSTADDHGTHVSALAVGYAEDGDGAVRFRGAAPAAQLLSMKVFPDRSGGGADDATVLKALEDAYALGADIINLSLGSPNGFAADNALNGLYCAAFQRLRQEGVLLTCAAGNAGASTSYKIEGSPLPTGGYTDYGTVNAPASYLGATAVAAADAMSFVSAGAILAGDRAIPYADGVAEDGDPPPKLATLSGKDFPLAAIGGVGEQKDFAGRDLTGKIALVERGVITFTQKVQNAQNAGAAACILYNNEPGSIRAVVEDSTIPAVTVSQEDGKALLALAGEGGSVSISGQPFLAEVPGGPAMLAPSSWGTTSDLRLTPVVTAPGGSILSASAQGDGAYVLESGTSMAAPNTAGALAVLLQALGQRGITDRIESAQMAEDLLLSTARPMTDGTGTPLSPRRQGAGLLDLSAALESELVVQKPLLELGDSQNGRFSLTFTVRNLSQEEKTLTVTPTILTDDWTDGHSRMAPRNITDRVTVTGAKSVTLPAGESREVRLTLAVSQDLRRELKDIFPNGFFTEGYITLADAENRAVHATFLGYCGDWQAAPILEPTDFRDVLNAAAQGEEAPAGDLGLNLVYISHTPSYTDGSPLLGENPWADTAHSDGRNAIPGKATDALDTAGSFLTTELYTLRNAAHVVMVVTDQRTGAVYAVDDTPWLPKATLSDLTLAIEPTGIFFWDGTDAHGDPLPDGTAATVDFYAWLDSDRDMAAAYGRRSPDPAEPESYRWLTSGSYDRCLEWTFPVVVDSAAPTVEAELQGDLLALTFSDRQFLSHAAVLSGTGETLAEETFADETAGTAHTLTVDLSALDQRPETVYVTAADYASNTVGYAVELTGLEAERCVMALLTDVDREAGYHEAVDFVCGERLMDWDADLTFRPQDGATRIQLITALYRLAGSPAAGGEVPFTDVPASADYRSEVRWAYENRLVTGYNSDFFGAYANVNRQQAAALLHRFAALEGELPVPDAAVLSQFPDGDTVPGWAKDALAWAVEEDLLPPRESGNLAPKAYLSRAELAEVLMRYCQIRS